MPKRRGNGEGTVYQRKDGRWMAQVTVGLTLEGKSKRKTFYGSTRKEAVGKMAEVLHEIKAGSYIEPSIMTLGLWVEKWLEAYKKPTIRVTTYEGYQITAKTHIVPLLGMVKLKDLQPSMLQEFYNKKSQEGLSASYVRHMHVIIRGALKQAQREGLINRNVAEAAAPPKLNGNSKMNILTAGQLKLLMDRTRNDKLGSAYILAINTGLRRGELLGLTWDCVDLKKSTITVKQQLLMINGRPALEYSTKSQAGKRVLPISEHVNNYLKRYKIKQVEERMLMGKDYQDHGLVFCKEDGSPLNPKNFTKHFQIKLKKMTLPKIRFHDLRHSHASLLLAQGVHPKVVQERLGHSSITVTLDNYSHLVPGMQEAAVAEINNLFSQSV